MKRQSHRRNGRGTAQSGAAIQKRRHARPQKFGDKIDYEYKQITIVLAAIYERKTAIHEIAWRAIRWFFGRELDQHSDAFRMESRIVAAIASVSDP
jgi:hypothetical protein